MRKNRVKKICINCDKEFEIIKSRENAAKTCSRKCYHEYAKTFTPWNKGKSYDELYDSDKEKEIKEKQSNNSKGENNPMFGKHHSEETKKLMSLKKENYIPWIKGKKLPGLFKDIDRTGKNNAYVKYLLKTENITYEEYLERLKTKEGYYKMVRNITNLQPIHLLENFDKRGVLSYHLDHIYPIAKGFENNIPPSIIGDISNLRFIHWEDNIEKSDKLL